MPDDLKPPTERIPLPSWIRTPKIVRTEMMALVQELAEVKRRLEKAEEQLRRNSQNSSQPPSQDKPGHKPSPEDEPGAKRRTRGGQKGHAGHQRALQLDARVHLVVSQQAAFYPHHLADDCVAGFGGRQADLPGAHIRAALETGLILQRQAGQPAAQIDPDRCLRLPDLSRYCPRTD